MPYLFLGETAPAAGANLAEQVRAKLKRWAELYSADPDANYYYALNLEQALSGGASDQSSKIELLLKKAVELNPRLAVAHEQLGSVYSERGQHPEAILEYRQALLIAPDLARVHYRLAQVYMKTGELKLAQEFEQFHRLRDNETAAAQDSGGAMKQALSSLTGQGAGEQRNRPPCQPGNGAQKGSSKEK